MYSPPLCRTPHTHSATQVSTFDGWVKVMYSAPLCPTPHTHSTTQVSTFDGWVKVMYFALDAAGVDTQPSRERAFLNSNVLPLLYFGTFIIFGALFVTNVFVAVVTQSFQETKMSQEGSAVLTRAQVSELVRVV